MLPALSAYCGLDVAWRYDIWSDVGWLPPMMACLLNSPAFGAPKIRNLLVAFTRTVPAFNRGTRLEGTISSSCDGARICEVTIHNDIMFQWKMSR